MTKPVISIIMGSKIRLGSKTAEVLDNFGVAYEKKVVSLIGRTSCSNMPKHVAVASRSSSQVLVALLTCQG